MFYELKPEDPFSAYFTDETGAAIDKSMEAYFKNILKGVLIDPSKRHALLMMDVNMGKNGLKNFIYYTFVYQKMADNSYTAFLQSIMFGDVLPPAIADRMDRNLLNTALNGN